jgi:outer membrane autotransporter protein
MHESGSTIAERSSAVAKPRTKAKRDVTLLSGTAALELLIMIPLAAFSAIERAEASCTPLAPVNNTTVDCTLATSNQNAGPGGNNGYGTNTETGLTINVHSGASVTGTVAGIDILKGTINNSGTVSGDFAIFLATGGTVNNNLNGSLSVIQSTLPGGIGIASSGNLTSLTVSNGAGTILATGQDGIAIQSSFAPTTINNGTGIITGALNAISVLGNGNLTLTGNDGLISAAGGTVTANRVAISAGNADITNGTGTIGSSAPGSTAIFATGVATVDNGKSSSGLISGSAFGIQANTVNVTANIGTIEASGAAGHAIDAAGNANITNGINGTVQALSTNGVAISAGGTATVINLAGGRITGDAAAIDADVLNATGNINVTGNDGTISGGTAIHVAGSGTASVTNGTGTIQATGPSGIAISALTGTATVSNGTGTIAGNLFGIDAATVTVTGNKGTISAAAASGTAIGADTLDVTNNAGGTITATGVGGIAIDSSGAAKVNNLSGGIIAGAATGVHATALDVINNSGGTISGGIFGIQGGGSVINAGTIAGGTASVQFTGAGTNTLILQTGSVLSGNAVGSTATGGTNNLILQGHGTASNGFLNFNTLDVQASGSWLWNTNATIGATNVSSGTLVVDGELTSPVMVNSVGTLAGNGTVTGNVSVASGATIAPGSAVPFSTLNVNGNVNFAAGSSYRVAVNPTGQNDKLAATGIGTLTGATVNVLAQNAVFPPATQYTILTAAGGLGGTTFSGVTSNLFFLTPSLSYDANDVFLTLKFNNNAFHDAAQTPNQAAVGSALDASPKNSSLVTTLLNQSLAGARQAFEALSGEIFGTVHNTQAQEVQFGRSAVLGRLRQSSYEDIPGELGALGFGGPQQLAYASGDAYAAMPGKAPAQQGERLRDLTFWAQGLGGRGSAESDGNAAALTSRFGGFLSGVDARYGDMLRAGLMAGYVRSDLNVDARASGAGIDSAQLGAYAGGRVGALNVRGGVSYSFDSVDTSRTIAFPGFFEQTHAHSSGNVGQAFGEVGYGMAFNRVAVEPIAGLAYVHLHNGSFLESGGIAALSGSSVGENIGYSWAGLRVATAVPLANGTVLVPRGSLQWQHAFGDVTPTSALSFQGTGAGFSVAGLPIASNAALVEGGLDWRFSPQAKLGVSYQGELAAQAQTHTVKGAFTWNF